MNPDPIIFAIVLVFWIPAAICLVAMYVRAFLHGERSFGRFFFGLIVLEPYNRKLRWGFAGCFFAMAVLGIVAAAFLLYRRRIAQLQHLEFVAVDGNRVGISLHLRVKVPEDRVVLQQMGKRMGAGDVVDRDEVDILVAERGPHDVAADAAEATGWLSHHAVHDEAAWDFLERLFETVRAAGGPRWVGAQELFHTS